MRVAPIDHHWWYDRWLRTYDPGLVDCTHVNQVDRTSVQVCIVTVVCQILNPPSTHTTEKYFTHLLKAKVEHVTALRKQTAPYEKNA